VTAVLAVIAVLVPASVTLVGYWFKQQAQKRLELERQQANDLKQQAENRLELEQKQSNDRLRLDAAMRAAELFGPYGDALTGATRSASGLLALTRLDFVELAVALLADLWSTQENARDSFGVTTETAIQVINAALKSGKPDAQLMAAELLCRNASALDMCNSLNWPSSVDSAWIPDLPVTAKLLIVDSLIFMALTSKKTQNNLRELAVRLYGISNGDPLDRVKGCIGTLIQAILPAVENLGFKEFMKGPDREHDYITLDQMKDAAKLASPHPDGFFEIIVNDRSKRLEQWSQECTGLSYSGGMLAVAGCALNMHDERPLKTLNHSPN
jgi:hypothetical protein